MDFFKIECQGAFKADRGNLLVGCVHDTVRAQDADIVLVASDGDLIPTHRAVLGLYSRTLPSVVDSLPCCQNVAVSVPFKAKTISSLLKLITLGSSDPVDQKSLASLTECAQVLGITLSGLEIVEKKNIVTLEVGEGLRINTLLQNGAFASSADAAPKMAAKIVQRGGAKTGSAKRKNSKPRSSGASSKAMRYSEDDIIEITPEMYAASGNIHTDISAEDDIMPHHFLMQGNESGPNQWNQDENSWDLHDPKGVPIGHGVDENGVDPTADTSPHVEEIPSPDDETKMVYTCSFCPGQYFNKKNDINRHLKKHVPIEMRKRHQCDGCKEKFINNSNLKVHMKVCSGKVREFPCKKCGDIQYNKTDHIDHMAQVHNVVKKHGCPICHKQLKKTSDLKKHMATHSNAKPFSCEVCGKKFKTESYVKVHMKSHFPDKEIPEHILEAMAAQQAAMAAQQADLASPMKMRPDCADDCQSPNSEGPRSDAQQDSESEQSPVLIINEKEIMGEDEGELIIEEDALQADNDVDNIVIDQDDMDTSAQMEYDDVTDSPAVPTHADSPPAVAADSDHVADQRKDNQLVSDVINSGGDGSGGYDDATKQDVTVQDCYPKKDLYVSQISQLRKSTEIA